MTNSEMLSNKIITSHIAVIHCCLYGWETYLEMTTFRILKPKGKVAFYIPVQETQVSTTLFSELESQL